MKAYPTDRHKADRHEAGLPAYLSNLGMRAEPFLPRAENAFFYADPGRMQRLNLLLHLVLYSELLLVTGPRGSGKTTILNQFVNKAGKSWRVWHIKASSHLQSGNLVDEVMAGFDFAGGIKYPPDEWGDTLRRHLKAMRGSGLHPIFIIDDAHLLPDSSLDVLKELLLQRDEEGSLLHIILFAEPVIVQRLANPTMQGLHDRLSHTFELLPFNEEQTGQYIRHRLNVAGLSTNGPFNARTVREILHQSGGLPGRINELAQDVLIKHSEEFYPNPNVSKEGVANQKHSKLLATGIIVAVVFVVTLLYFDDLSQFYKNSGANLAGSSLKKLPAQTTQLQKTPVVTAAGEAEALAPDRNGSVGKSVAEKNRLKIGKEKDDSQITSRKKLDESLSPGRGGHLTQSVPDQSAKTASNDSNEINRPLNRYQGDGNQGNSNQGGMTNNQPQIESDDARKVLPVLTQKNIPDAQAPSKSQIYTTNLEAEIKTGGFQLNNEKWILAQPSDHFTIQLIVTSQREKLASLAIDNKLGSDAAFFVTDHQGKERYTLVYGSYKSKQLARSAGIARLKNISGVKPWIRPVADVKLAIGQRVASRNRPSHDGGENVVRQPQRVGTVKDSLVTATRLPEKTGIMASRFVDSNEGAVDIKPMSWVLAQKPDYYTLQLIVTSSYESMVELVKSQQLSGSVSYFESGPANEKRYSLLYGFYAEREQAEAAQDLLTDSLQISPWIRSFGDIHPIINRQLQAQNN